MTNSELKSYFNKIKEGTNGDNTSDSDIIDYENGESISINDIEEEYKKYIMLQNEIDDYIDINDLDDVNDEEKIKKHFSNIDIKCFEFNQAVLKDFTDYMIITINNKNKNIRKANLSYNKNGNGFDTIRINIPVPWAKELGFSSEDRSAKIELKNNSIIITKESE